MKQVINWIVPPALLAVGAMLLQRPLAAQDTTERERQLLERIQKLEERLAAVEARFGPAVAAPATPAAAPVAQAAAAPPALPPATTVNFLLDGYYEYNFNRPAGRVNQLRAFDPSSNSFTLNQGAMVVERAADPSQGRRFGLRLDLLFGQTTEGLSGSPVNEPRPSPYRNILQAYGTFVAPLGSGLNVDFGRFITPIGMEGPFAKDQINYTRSLLFAALPAYHTGFRTAYKLTDKVTATWMLVNGINQMEDFNGFKSNHFMLTAALSKNFSWTGGYYVGRESREAAPGQPEANGRTHIGNTYFTWSATPKLTLAGEGDLIVSRVYSNSYPSRLAGGAGYLKYQLAPAFSLAGRFEYLSDRGGYLSGDTQALKDLTMTAAYQPADGFQIRWEFRRDYSNRPYFLSETPGVLKRDQSTAAMALIWWFGGKQGAW
jgi:hypothetical protein